MPPRYQRIIAWIGGVVGLAFIGSGLYINDVSVWRLQLLAGLWLCSFVPRAYTERSRGISHSLGRVTLVVGLCFSAVALQLVREQVIQAPATRAQAVTLFQPVAEQTNGDTEIRLADRTSVGSARVWPVTIDTTARGDIRDRNGTVVATTEQGRRVYLNPDLGHIVGFASSFYGTAGIEASFDDYLSGMHAISPTELLEARLLGTSVAAQPADVQLTLDLTLQEAAKNALGDRAGAVMLLDPQTGAILALASFPRFNPNRLVLPAQASEADVAALQETWERLINRGDSPLLNRATQGRYAPGSVIKTLTAAAALDSGVLSGPEGQVTCPNRLNTEAGAPPVVNSVENLARSTGDPSDLNRVFAFSCNTAFAQLGLPRARTLWRLCAALWADL